MTKETVYIIQYRYNHNAPNWFDLENIEFTDGLKAIEDVKQRKELHVISEIYYRVIRKEVTLTEVFTN